MKNWLWLGLCLVSAPTLAWNDCAHEREIDQQLELAGGETLTVQAAAGDLEIRGVDGISDARIKGRLCASDEELLARSELETEAGRNPAIRVELPNADGNREYVYLDLYIDVPVGTALDVRDSSGGIEIDNVGAVSVQDSSGSIEISLAEGDIEVQDSSGDVVLTDIEGDVIIVSDSSGDLRGKHISGSVLVRNDSSGEIHFSDVGKDFVVEKDSSGDIVANRIGGDFRVERDGSGDISAIGVEGEVQIPKD